MLIRNVVFQLLSGIILLCIAIFSETVQNNLSIYWLIHSELGEGMANFVLGQLGDLVFPISLGFIFGCVGYVFDDDIDVKREMILKTTIASMIFVSICYCVTEIVLMFMGGFNCGKQSYFCTGDLPDLLVFSVPMIAFAIFVAYKKSKV